MGVGCSLSGMVVEDGTAIPLEDYDLGVWPAGEYEGAPGLLPEAGRFLSSRFEIRVMPGELMRLVVRKAGYHAFVSDPFVRREGGVCAPLSVALRRVQAVAGRVLDCNGAPVVGAVIRWTAAMGLGKGLPRDPRKHDSGVFCAVSSQEGAFVVEPPEKVSEYVVWPRQGLLGLTFRRPPEPFLVVSHPAGAVTLGPEAVVGGVELRLRPWSRIVGEVRMGGRPQAGQTVRAVREAAEGVDYATAGVQTGVTDAYGRFEFGLVGAGRWVVGVDSPPQARFGSVLVPFARVEVAVGMDVRVQLCLDGRPVVGRCVNGREGQTMDWRRVVAVLQPRGGGTAGTWCPVGVRPPGLISGGYPLTVSEDGLLRSMAVPAGTYELSLFRKEGDREIECYSRLEVLEGEEWRDAREVMVVDEGRGGAGRVVELGRVLVRAPLATGDPVPPLRLWDRGYRRVEWESLGGRPVLVTFCQPGGVMRCRAGQKQLRRLVGRAGVDGAVFVVVLVGALPFSPVMGRLLSGGAGADLVAVHGNPWPWRGDRGRREFHARPAVLGEWSVSRLPSTCLVGPDGRLAWCGADPGLAGQGLMEALRGCCAQGVSEPVGERVAP